MPQIVRCVYLGLWQRTVQPFVDVNDSVRSARSTVGCDRIADIDDDDEDVKEDMH
jgi:hypothetical protein